MDIVSHGLWAGAAGLWVRRHRALSRAQLGWMVFLGIAPDLLQALPVIAWAITQPHAGSILYSWSVATPGSEPFLPPLVREATMHLHCIMHSIVIAGPVTLAIWRWKPAWLAPLVGWWLHIALDIPTHSSDYYEVPFLYPISYRGFDGVPWTAPWLIIGNYVLLAIAFGLLRARRITNASRAPR